MAKLNKFKIMYNTIMAIPERNLPNPDVVPGAQALTADIMRGELSEQDKTMLKEKRTFYESLKGDEATIDAVNALIAEVEPIDKWRDVARKARTEIETLPPDILERVFNKATPYIKNLPAGHGKGHFLRDTINATLLLQDPAMSTYPPEEVMSGILAAMYHDIGNSVVNRYEETNRFAAHGEVGAHLFGEIAKDILPPNLLKMTQLSIAGHTHYTADAPILRDSETGVPVEVTKGSQVLDKDGQEITSPTYSGEVQIKNPQTGEIKKRNVVRRVRKAQKSTIEDGAKTAMWISRWTDRLDTRGVSHAVRHIITKASPTRDFDGKEFNTIHPDEQIDFQREFEPRQNPNSKNVIGHFLQLADSDTKIDAEGKKGIYNQYDTGYMTEKLFGPEDLVMRELVKTIENAPESMSRMDQAGKDAILKDGMAKFEALCRLLEPARDLEGQLGLLKEKFGKLGEPSFAWALGFKQLFDKLYPETEGRKTTSLRNISPLNFGNQPVSERMNTILGGHLYDIARSAEEQFKQKPLTTL